MIIEAVQFQFGQESPARAGSSKAEVPNLPRTGALHEDMISTILTLVAEVVRVDLVLQPFPSPFVRQ